MLVLALLLDAVFGEPRWLWSRMPHPAVIMGRAVSALDRHWNKGSHKEIKGAVAVAALVIGAGLIGWGLSQFGILVSILCAAILLAQKSLVLTDNDKLLMQKTLVLRENSELLLQN